MPNGLAVGGVSFPLLAPDGSSAAPSYSFTNYATAGMYAFVGGVGLSYGGLRASITALGVVINNSQILGWAAGGEGSTTDVILTRDAANVLAQRNGTAAQEFRVYGTTTGSKYLSLVHSATYGAITTATAVDLFLGVNLLSQAWGISGGSGALYPGSNGVLSVGLTGNRVSALFLGGNTPAASAPMIDCAQTWNDAGVTFVGVDWTFTDTNSAAGSLPFRIRGGAAGTTVLFQVEKDGKTLAPYYQATGAGYFFLNGGRIEEVSDGVFALRDAAYTSFSRLCFGGTTASFPSIKRNGAGLAFVVADDSAYAAMTALSLSLIGGAVTFSGVGAIVPVSDGVIGLYDSAATSFGRLCFGGTTSSFPALLRSGTALVVMLADNSERAAIYSYDSVVKDAGGFHWDSRGSITASADGVLVLKDTAATSFGRLCFGGTTSSFPACKRSGAGLLCRLADDSNYADFTAASIGGAAFYVNGTLALDSSLLQFNGDTSLARIAAASLRLGLAPSATPVAQTFTVGEFSRVGTDNNVAGSDGTIRSGSGTGNAAGSSLFFDTPTVGASGTVQQSYAHRLTLSALGATFDIPDQGLRINNQVNGAGASAGTLTNAPSAGNPNFWLPISIAGVTRYFPGW